MPGDRYMGCFGIVAPSHFNMCAISEATLVLLSTMVMTFTVRMPGGGLPTVAVVFCPIELSASMRRTTRIAIRVSIFGKSGIHIVVDFPVRLGQVHIKFHRPTSEVVGCLGTDTPSAVNRPTTSRLLGRPIISFEVVRCPRTIRRQTRGSWPRGPPPRRTWRG